MAKAQDGPANTQERRRKILELVAEIDTMYTIANEFDDMPDAKQRIFNWIDQKLQLKDVFQTVFQESPG